MSTTTRGRYADRSTRATLRRWLPAAIGSLALFIVIALLAACSGTEATVAPSDPPSQPQPVEPVAEETAEPTPTTKPKPKKDEPLTIEQAAERYLEIIGPVNAAATEADALMGAGRFREGCDAMVAPAGDSLDKFAAEQWPGDADRLIKDQLIPLTEAEIAAYSSCASASNDNRAEEIVWSDVYDAQEARSAVSGAVRTLLGLPQVRP